MEILFPRWNLVIGDAFVNQGDADPTGKDMGFKARGASRLYA
jgi:hypothetical protein